MASFQNDQAEGLRRMLARPKPRVITFLSSVHCAEPSSLLYDLGASLVCAGSTVVALDGRLLHQTRDQRLRAGKTSHLLGLARGACSLPDTLTELGSGFSMVSLAPNRGAWESASESDIDQVQAACCTLAAQNDFLLIDGELTHHDRFPIPIMDHGDIVVQLSSDPDSIKQAYAMIKRLCTRLGRRPMHVLVTGCYEDEAQRVFANLESAASRFLAISLRSVGYVPSDEHLARAARLGRPVIDAYPTAGASRAFRQLAGKIATNHGFQRVG